jgi:hypothetical protein
VIGSGVGAIGLDSSEIQRECNPIFASYVTVSIEYIRTDRSERSMKSCP